jgi:hypothetical protein
VLLDRREEEAAVDGDPEGASDDSATGEAAGLTLRELNWLCSASAFSAASEGCTRPDGPPGLVHGSGMQLR